MILKRILVVLIIATAVNTTLVSAANVSVTIPTHGVINYESSDLEEDIPSAGNDASDMFDYAPENLNESNHEDACACDETFSKGKPTDGKLESCFTNYKLSLDKIWTF